MIHKIFSVALLLGVSAGISLSSIPVVAQGEPQVCGPRDTIIDRLSARYQEQQSAIGMTSGGSLVELFVSPTGTWTFVHTSANGVTCLLAAGEDWEHVLPQTGELDAQPS